MVQSTRRFFHIPSPTTSNTLNALYRSCQVALYVHNLGVIARKKRRFKEAWECYSRALEINEKVLGKGHPLTGSNLNGLGLVKRKLRELDEAADLHQRAIAIFETRLGYDHKEVALTLNYLVRDTPFLFAGAPSLTPFSSRRPRSIEDRANISMTALSVCMSVLWSSIELLSRMSILRSQRTLTGRLTADCYLFCFKLVPIYPFVLGWHKCTRISSSMPKRRTCFCVPWP